MLNSKQIKEIRSLLESFQNPIFFFDSDTDGFCSFILLRKYLERGSFFPVTNSPDLNESYFRKVEELNADSIVILDRPVVSEDFFKRVKERNLPVLWIDHHISEGQKIPKFVKYYNDFSKGEKGKSPEAVTAYCYQISKRKEDLWIAVVGSLADHFIPPFYKEFAEKYPDLQLDSEDPFEILFNSPIGTINSILNFSLKDRTTNVINFLKFFLTIKTPYEILYRNPKESKFYFRYEELEKNYKELLKKAIKKGSEEILFFKYSGENGFSSELSNELSYRFPEKIIIIARVKSLMATISGRGENIRGPFLEALKKFPEGGGGGHENAVGGRLNKEHLEDFEKEFLKIISPPK